MPRRPAPRRILLPPDVRRQQLLDAAIHVFARKGYRNTSIADVIARAGVARGTFYLHFPGKEQIFGAIVAAFHDRVKSALEALDDAAEDVRAAGPRAVLEASFRAWLGLFAGHRDAARVVLREARAIDPRFEQGFADLRRLAVSHFAARFRTLQRLGAVRADIDPDLAAHLQLGMFDELLNAFVIDRRRADLDRLAGRLADFEWNGIRPWAPRSRRME
ncbi:MAG: TetR/AcrR family transcriptional regulator [Betaproteobacteria bacterium]